MAGDMDTLAQRGDRQSCADVTRQAEQQARGRCSGQGGDARKGHAPTEPVTHQCAQRHAEGNRDRNAAIDDGQRRAAPFWTGDRAGQRVRAGNIETGGCGEQDAGRHQFPIILGAPRDDVRCRERAERQDHQRAPVERAGHCCEDR